MFKKILIVLVLFSIIIPSTTNAQTTDDIARQIAGLKQQIAELQRQLAWLQGQKAGQSCYNFDKNFGVGANGKQVTALQTVLAKEGLLPTPLPMPMTKNSDDDQDKEEDRQEGQGYAYGTASYTEMTAAAVSALQLKYQNEILTPLGLTSPTGYVGPSTRKVLNRLYGCNRVILIPIPGNLPPVISGVLGPTTLKMGETGTWEAKASDPENGPLSYSVIWGDEPVYSSVTGAPMMQKQEISQTASFTHSYAVAGTYNPTFTVTDNFGQSAKTSLSVNVGNAPSSPITVLTPNGGETLVQKTRHSVTWRANAINISTVDLYILPVQSCPGAGGTSCLPYIPSPVIIERNLAGNIYDWSVGMFHAISGWTEGYVQDGYYQIVVCSAGAQPGFYGVNEFCDSSDTFTIVSNQSKITVTSPNGGEQWVASSTQAITWRYDGAASDTKADLWLQREWSCPAGMVCAQFMSQPIVLDKNIPALFTYNWIVGTDIVNNLISTGQYRVYVCPAGSSSPFSNECDGSDNYFTIFPATVAP